MPETNDPDWEIKAKEFGDKFGPLIPRMQGSPLEGSEVSEYAKRFRQAWKNPKSDFDYQEINSTLDDILTNDPFSRQIVGADFEAGKWEPHPKTLLGVLAVTLLRSREMDLVEHDYQLAVRLGL